MVPAANSLDRMEYVSGCCPSRAGQFPTTERAPDHGHPTDIWDVWDIRFGTRFISEDHVKIHYGGAHHLRLSIHFRDLYTHSRCICCHWGCCSVVVREMCPSANNTDLLRSMKVKRQTGNGVTKRRFYFTLFYIVVLSRPCCSNLYHFDEKQTIDL